jgi:rare lipoprotein A
MLRKARQIHVGAAALTLAIPVSALALTAGQADAQSATQINLSPRQVAFGADVKVTGNASPINAGHALELQFAPAGATSWRAVASTKVAGDGSFRFVEQVKRSGLLRVIGAGAATSTLTTGRVAGSGSASIAPSASALVSVASKFRVPTGSTNLLSGQRAHVRGTLLPAVAGRQVRLISRAGGSWRALATARTGPKGGFDLQFAAGNTGQQSLRVRFAGDRLNTRSSTQSGQLTVFRQSGASWYNDGGATACGFHANFGVASRDLPCGTKVTFHYGGHTVTAVVDDRGPFVGGRDWDLNQNTAAALGFGGVDTVWSSA